MTTPRPASPDITLANGRAVTCTRQPNGSQDARMADGGPMSTAAGREWDELHAAAVALCEKMGWFGADSLISAQLPKSGSVFVFSPNA